MATDTTGYTELRGVLAREVRVGDVLPRRCGPRTVKATYYSPLTRRAVMEFEDGGSDLALPGTAPVRVLRQETP